MRRLAGKGRRHALMIAPPLDQTYAQHMVAGARAAAEEAGMAMQVAEAATSDSGMAMVRQTVSSALAEDGRIDGIVCASTSAAMAAVAALEAAGRRLGEDIDVASKEAIPFLTLFRPQIMSVDEDVREAGEFLARAAMRAVREPELPPMQKLDVPSE